MNTDKRTAIARLGTEQRNPKTVNIDRVSTEEMLYMINDEDAIVPQRVRAAIPQIAAAIELIFPRLENGGRVVYVGSGTSARIGFVDAAECPPSYHIQPGIFNCLMAGGRECVFLAKEEMEDFAEHAKRDLKNFGLTEKDTVVALAASGRTPYSIGALQYAAEIGAGRVSISCNINSELGRYSDVAIDMDTGAEVIMGSTRMKAASAQKLVLSMLSTGLMIKQGRTYSNLMITPRPNNSKVNDRSVRRFAEAVGNPDLDYARERLVEADGCVRCAIVRELTGCELSVAQNACDECDGRIKLAIRLAEQAVSAKKSNN